MKMRNKVMVLALSAAGILGVWNFFSGNAQARVCFIVGNCDKEIEVKDCRKLKFRNCPAEGLKSDMKSEVCKSGNALYTKKCLCDEEVYPNKENDHESMYEYEGKQCEDSTGVYYEHKICKEEYKYIPAGEVVDPRCKSGFFSNLLSNCKMNLSELNHLLQREGYHGNITLCHENATPVEQCTETIGKKGEEATMLRYKSCVCNPSKYIYTLDFDRIAFKGVGECENSSGEKRYERIECSGIDNGQGVWRSRCEENEKPNGTKTAQGITCRYCVAENANPCGYEGYETVDECYNSGRTDSSHRRVCKLEIVNGKVCYKRSEKSCADAAIIDYYGYDGTGGIAPIGGYYGATNSSYIAYFDTEEECLEGIFAGQTCKAKTLWNETYYGSHDSKTCYYRL